MSSPWVTKKLGDVCEIYQPKTITTKEMTEYGAYPVFGANGVIGRFDKYNHEEPQLLITCRGATCGSVNVSESFSWITGNAMVVRPKNPDIDLKMLEYIFRGAVDISKSITGAAQPQITRTNLSPIEISYPSSLPEQQRIVSILDEAFAGIATATANAEKNLANARELFESYLQSVFDNKGGDWEEAKLVEMCSLITCGVASTPKYVDESEGVAFLSAQNVRNGEVVLDKYRYISKEFHKELTKKNKPEKGDILYSRVGSKFGEAGVVEHEFEFSVYVSVTLIKPIPNKLDSYFLKHYLNSPHVKSLALKSITSSGVPNLNVKDVRLFPIKYPTISKQHEIVGHINDMRRETQRLEEIYLQKLNALEELKKSILNQAFSGQLQ